MEQKGQGTQLVANSVNAVEPVFCDDVPFMEVLEREFAMEALIARSMWSLVTAEGKDI